MLLIRTKGNNTNSKVIINYGIFYQAKQHQSSNFMLPITKAREYDLCIVGGGLAGISLAVRASESGLKVCLICKQKLANSASSYAQGGIAAVLDEQDSPESHIKDTMIAGAGLCHLEVVKRVIERGPDNIRWLIEKGVRFSTNNETPSSAYHLTREGGHSHRRVIHAADATGYEISSALEKHIRRDKQISLFEYYFAIDLVKVFDQGRFRVCGMRVLNTLERRIEYLPAKIVILASGGFSHAWLYSSNPEICSGDGIAMALRSGCRVMNMEFIQFHPTCLYHRNDRSFLISETLRGEGGKLLLPNGQPFMQRYDERLELAPRDIVARAIDSEMKSHNVHHVLLDISHKPSSWIQSAFPNIYRRCLKLGIDICNQPIPVVPAAHYCCGGVYTNEHAQTDLEGLFAIGECACTGMHGANRLASNSLLECLVYSESAYLKIMEILEKGYESVKAEPSEASLLAPEAESIVVDQNWHELRRTMWNYVGIVRRSYRMQLACKRLRLIHSEVEHLVNCSRLSPDLLELRNLCTVALATVQSALKRKESRGLHYNSDYPNTIEPQDTMLNFEELEL